MLPPVRRAPVGYRSRVNDTAGHQTDDYQRSLAPLPGAGGSEMSSTTSVTGNGVPEDSAARPEAEGFARRTPDAVEGRSVDPGAPPPPDQQEEADAVNGGSGG